jgi:hypothetical protein
MNGDESQLYVSDVDGCLAEKLTGRWLVLAMRMDGCSFGRNLNAIPRGALVLHGCGRG